MTAKRWTDEAKAMLRDLAPTAIGSREIGRKLQKKFGPGFGVSAVTSMAHRLGIAIQIPPRAGKTATDSVRDAEARSANRERRATERTIANLKQMVESHTVPVSQYFGTSARFALGGDTQLGSLYDRHDILEKAYVIARDRGVKSFFHTGDMFDGIKVYKGHEYELEHHGSDKQVQHGIDTYPQVKGITTYFIGGNHDYSFFKHSGALVCKQIAARDAQGERLAGPREDMVFLGQDEATVIIKVGGTDVRLMLKHPTGGTAYAISYRSQKIVESLPGGRKPELLAIGHYHKADWLPTVRNIHTFQTGCFQSQTPFMRNRGLEAHLGFWICEVRATKIGVASCKGEFINFYEM